MRRVVAGLIVLAAALSVAAPGRASTLFLVEGGGWGHGVGLGQWGAEGYALHGWTARQIVAHYYPHTTLETEPSPMLRILLGEQEAEISIGSAKPFLLVDARGRKVHVKGRTLELTPRLRLGNKPLVAPVEVKAGAEPLAFDGKRYRGSLTLLVRQGELSVVNNVSMQMYLRGVVPSELPKHWLPAAYEAQAIAARSYALAERRGTGDFDLYPDTRDQMYLGRDAERKETNEAVAATSGQVLTYDGAPILAYYSASTGGRTEAVEDAFPGRAPIPYLVSVPDPYDVISPVHHWLLRLNLRKLSQTLGFVPTEVQVEHDAAGHASAVELAGDSGTRTVSGTDFMQTLGFRSSRFSIVQLSLDSPTVAAAFDRPFGLRGVVRNAADVVLERRDPGGDWQIVGHVHPAADGQFTIKVRPLTSTAYRLAIEDAPAPPVTVQVEPRLSVRAQGNVVSGTIRPSVPLQIEKNIRGAWRVIAHVATGPSGGFRKALQAGRYRIASTASRELASATSTSVVVAEQRVRLKRGR